MPLGAALLALTLPAATAELNAKPHGRIKVDYGAAQWQEAWEERIFDGMIWRLSAANPNRAVIEPALLFDDAVVFPGTYNLGLAHRGDDQWGLVFHSDGLNWNAGPCEAETRFVREWLEEEDLVPRLTIDLSRRRPTTGDGDANTDPYQWTVDLGPRHLTKSFRTARAAAVKGKVGKHRFTFTTVEREDLDAVRRELEEDEVVVARVESKSLELPARAHLRAGETCRLVIWRGEDWAAPLFLDGQAGKAQKPSEHLDLSIESGRDAATLTFTVGEDAYVFDLPPKLFEKKSLDD
ncbi:MAG: hypothetical protein ACF8XB_23120 [Planctomycetota bacterium JB042]